MNIAKMMKEAQRMQERMAEDIVSIKIDPQVVDPQDVEFLEDLVLKGVQQALEDAKALAGAEMGKLTGGLKIPGL